MTHRGDMAIGETGTAGVARAGTGDAAVALGANLGDRAATLEQAVAMLEREVGTLIARSRWHETAAAIHPEDDASWHPPFLNGVVRLRMALGPAALLDALQAIERTLGRDRTREDKPWQPRLIDLDLIAQGGTVLETPGLRLPHPEMHRRAFVLRPMLEVWPDWRHPILGKTVRELVVDLAG
jgi:2-amino-4-hydroxy-6-hydroxymethyldihydropteridine diphosphokinase